MIATLAALAVGLTAAGALFVALLVVRRLQLGQRERGRVALEERLRPVALAAVMGDPADVGALDRHEAQAFARVLARYGRQLSGDARDHIAAFFEGTGHLDAERARLGHRRGSVRAGAAYTLGDMGSRPRCPICSWRSKTVSATCARPRRAASGGWVPRRLPRRWCGPSPSRECRVRWPVRR